MYVTREVLVKEKQEPNYCANFNVMILIEHGDDHGMIEPLVVFNLIVMRVVPGLLELINFISTQDN